MSSLSEKLVRGQVQLSSLPEQTKWVDETIVSLSTDFGGAVEYSKFRCTRDSNGVFSLDFTFAIEGTSGNATHTVTLGLGGTTFAALQALTTSINSGVVALTTASTNNLVQTGTSVTAVRVSGTAILTGKPDWFDANREEGFSVLAQIGNATADDAGLVYKPVSAKLNLDSGDITTTSSSLVDVTGVTLTIILPVAGRIAYSFMGAWSNNGTGTNAINVDVDGALEFGSTGVTKDWNIANKRDPLNISGITDELSAGSHTIKLRWSVAGGTATLKTGGTQFSTFSIWSI